MSHTSSERKVQIYIFDLDGTLADCEHRRHYARRDSPTYNYKKFLSECVNDLPMQANLSLFINLDLLEYTATYILSGRDERMKIETIDWLMKHCNFPASYRSYLEERIFMRPSGSNKGDEIIKPRLLEDLTGCLDARFGPGNWELMGIFDDRPKVIRKWQEMGIYTWDVGQGCADF